MRSQRISTRVKGKRMIPQLQKGHKKSNYVPVYLDDNTSAALNLAANSKTGGNRSAYCRNIISKAVVPFRPKPVPNQT